MLEIVKRNWNRNQKDETVLLVIIQAWAYRAPKNCIALFWHAGFNPQLPVTAAAWNRRGPKKLRGCFKIIFACWRLNELILTINLQLNFQLCVNSISNMQVSFCSIACMFACKNSCIQQLALMQLYMKDISINRITCIDRLVKTKMIFASALALYCNSHSIPSNLKLFRFLYCRLQWTCHNHQRIDINYLKASPHVWLSACSKHVVDLWWPPRRAWLQLAKMPKSCASAGLDKRCLLS
jgi:hypothetical protein